MLQSPHADPFSFQELQVPALSQVIRPQVLPEQALRISMLQGRGTTYILCRTSK